VREVTPIENIEKMETEINDSTKEVDTNDIEELENLKDELEKLRKDKIQGMITRSRARWVKSEENNFSCFLNLESRNYVEKTINMLKLANGTET